MRLGVCTTDFPTMPADKLFAKIKQLGFESVQLCFSTVAECSFESTPHCDLPPYIDDAAIEAIANAADRYGLELAGANGTCNLIHPDARMRAEFLSRFDEFADACCQLGIEVITLCSGTRSREGMWTLHPDNHTPDAWNDLRESLSFCAAVAEKYGLTLAIETEASNVIDTPQRARQILDEIGSPALKMVLDAANLFLPGTAHRSNVRSVLTQAFDAFGHDIVAAHGKDILDTDGIVFAPTGEGIIDYPFFVQKLTEYGYDGDFLLHSVFDEAKMQTAATMLKNIL